MKGKTIANATLVGQRGVNLIERIVMEMGFVWRPTGAVEAGIDGHIELRDPATGEALNMVIGAQSKAFDRPFHNESESRFHFYCDERDVDYWLKGNLPVVLIISRPRSNEVYWVSIKDYFGDPSRRGTHRVEFDKQADRFDINCRDALFKLAAPRDAGIYLRTPPKPECLISNLLPVAFLPTRIYVADTACRSRRHVWEKARTQALIIGCEWIIRNKRIISFRDLTRPEWVDICDRGTVEDFATDEWSQTEDEDRRRDFVDVLRQALRAMVRDDLDYHHKLEFFYFRPTPDLLPREINYHGLAKATDRTVFKGYPGDDGAVKYYRHSAFFDRFHRFDSQWYLEITPTYHFTSDGFHLRYGYERFLKKIKQIEGHEAVRGQLVMWAACLSPQGDMFKEPYPFLGFWDPVVVPVDRGIDDERWNAKKTQTNKQEDVRAEQWEKGWAMSRLPEL